MTNRVRVTVENRRCREVFSPVYLNTPTRREARDTAVELLRPEIDRVKRSMGPCNVYASVVTVKDGQR